MSTTATAWEHAAGNRPVSPRSSLSSISISQHGGYQRCNSSISPRLLVKHYPNSSWCLHHGGNSAHANGNSAESDACGTPRSPPPSPPSPKLCLGPPSLWKGPGWSMVPIGSTGAQAEAEMLLCCVKSPRQAGRKTRSNSALTKEHSKGSHLEGFNKG